MTIVWKKRATTALLFFAILLVVTGCTSIKYSYDTRTPFSGLKTYAWGPSFSTYGSQDPLLEANVQTFTDEVLAQKGFTRVAATPDFLVTTNYEPELGYAQYGYQLRMLTLNVYRPEKKELVWRGTAAGRIHTDAASGSLKHAVDGILSHFPPK